MVQSGSRLKALTVHHSTGPCLLYSANHFREQNHSSCILFLCVFQVRKAVNAGVGIGVATVVGFGIVALAGAIFGSGKKEKKEYQ